MKTTFIIVLPIFLFIQISQDIKCQNSKKSNVKNVLITKDSTKINFHIIPDEIDSYKGMGKKESEIIAVVKHTNLNKEDLNLSKLLFVGLEIEGDNFIEAFDFQENKIKIEKDIHYQIPLDLNYDNPYFEKMNLKENESKVDTIDLSVFYKFKETGIFKVRFVNKELNLSSNWDTLKVN